MSENHKITDPADIDIKALETLILDNKYDAVKDVLDTIDFNIVDISKLPVDKERQSLLHLACRVGSINLVELLNDLGQDINVVDIYNRTPLAYATLTSSLRENHSKLVEYLCGLSDVKVNIVAKGPYLGETALMHACWKCRFSAVEALVKRGANVNSRKEIDGFTPLMYAAYNKFGREEATRIMAYLIENGANKRAKNKTGQRAAELLELEHRVPISQINPQTPNFNTPENVNPRLLRHTPKNATPKNATPKNATPQRLTPDPPSARPRIHKPRIHKQRSRTPRSHTPRSHTPRGGTPRSHSPKGTPDPSAIQIRNEDPTRRNRTRKLRRF